MTASARTKRVAVAASTTIVCDLYLRLSDGRHENGSMPEREKALRGKASVLGWVVREVVVENDVIANAGGNGKSASAFKRRKVGTDANGMPIMRVWRPGFRKVLDDVATGRVQAVLAEDLDRTLRDPRDAQDFIDVIRYRGAWADSLSGSLKFTAGGTDAEIAMCEVMVSMARKSSADTARRVGDGRARKAAAGQFGGGRRPYGFRPDGLTVDDDEAEVIRRVADEILSTSFGRRGGTSLKSIAKDLRDRGVSTVTGAPWSAETLRDVMLRERNAGWLIHNRERAHALPGDPILPDDVHEAVKARLSDPARSTPGRAPCWLGTNIYRCVCGARMEIARGKGRAAAYRCSREGGTGDVHVRRNAEALDGYVTAVVIERLSRPDIIDAFTPPSTVVDVKALRAQAAALRELLDEFARDRADGLIDRAQMLAGTTRTKAKLDAIDAQLAAATDTSPLAPIAGAENVAETWERLSLGQQRSIVTALITVTVLPTVRKGSGFDLDAVRIESATVQGGR